MSKSLSFFLSSFLSLFSLSLPFSSSHHPLPRFSRASYFFVTLIITCSLQFQATRDFPAWPRAYTYTRVYPFNRGGHLLAAVLNVVIHDSGGATSPRSISIGNSARPKLISESVIDVVGFSAPIYFYAPVRERAGLARGCWDRQIFGLNARRKIIPCSFVCRVACSTRAITMCTFLLFFFFFFLSCKRFVKLPRSFEY